MNSEELCGKLGDILPKIFNKFSIKNAQYGKDENGLINFERAGELLGISREKALLGFVSKQIVHVCGTNPDNDKTYLDHVDDIIIYMAILKVMLTEKGEM